MLQTGGISKPEVTQTHRMYVQQIVIVIVLPTMQLDADHLHSLEVTLKMIQYFTLDRLQVYTLQLLLV